MKNSTKLQLWIWQSKTSLPNHSACPTQYLPASQATAWDWKPRSGTLQQTPVRFSHQVAVFQQCLNLRVNIVMMSRTEAWYLTRTLQSCSKRKSPSKACRRKLKRYSSWMSIWKKISKLPKMLARMIACLCMLRDWLWRMWTRRRISSWARKASPMTKSRLVRSSEMTNSTTSWRRTLIWCGDQSSQQSQTLKESSLSRVWRQKIWMVVFRTKQRAFEWLQSTEDS